MTVCIKRAHPGQLYNMAWLLVVAISRKTFKTKRPLQLLQPSQRWLQQYLNKMSWLGKKQSLASLADSEPGHEPPCCHQDTSSVSVEPHCDPGLKSQEPQSPQIIQYFNILPQCLLRPQKYDSVHSLLVPWTHRPGGSRSQASLRLRG